MCGRFTLTSDLKVIAERFAAPLPAAAPAIQPRWNIAPSQSVIVVNDTGQRQLVTMRWGLVPSWAKDVSIGNKMINARAETIAEKPAFRAALKKRRCLIPADGFYEWTTKPMVGKPVGRGSADSALSGAVRRPAPSKSAGMKQPVRIVLKSHEPFGFAGLWEHWTAPTGEEVLSCTIITTEVNELLKDIHHRMPVILPREAEAVWLDPKIQDAETLLPLLKPYPSEGMEYYPVDRMVNSPANDTPACIVPI